MEVTYHLHMLHSWEVEELSQLTDTIDQIARNNASAIKYDHKRLVFTVAGSDREQQKQALDALRDLVQKKTPAKITLPKKFRDGQTHPSDSTSGSTASSAPGSVAGSLIDIQDVTTSFSLIDMSPSLPEATVYTVEFHVDDEIRDPYEMYYADKRQKIDLPTMLANEKGCEAQVSPNGRTVRISGDSMPKITTVQRQLQKMQTYHLRKPFQVDRAALVYGSNRDEFRLVFVPILEHQYYAKHIKFFPSLQRNTPRPIEYCVIEKATYDDHQEDWVIRSDAKSDSRHAASPQRRPNVAHSPVREPARSHWGPPPQTPDRSGRYEASTRAEWFDQKNPTFGFNNKLTPTVASRQPLTPSQNNLNSNANRSYRTATNVTPSWSSTGGRSSPVLSNYMPQGQIRRVPQPEWGAPTFNTTGNGDFPSLPTGNRAPSKRSGMPSLPPPRSVAASNADYSRPPTLLSQAPQPSASKDIIFGDQDWDYLEDRASLSSGRQRSREMENSGLDVPRLRDPNNELADAQRTLRRLSNQQATPGGPSSQFSGSNKFIDTMRVYNMRRLAETIRSGLTELQGRRKEIRLFGRLGNVVYPTHPELLTRSWEFTDIDSVLVKKHSVCPWFSPITTTVTSHVNSLYGFLGKFKTESAYYEVECDTRTNPSSRYTRTLVTVPSTVAHLERVVTPWETFGEAMWNAVDKHTDFEILLQAREGVIHDTNSALGRTDVKPFSTFRKKLSLGTHNSHITCRNVQDYLEVRAINFRETRTYEKPGQFTVEIHKIEELELVRTEGIDSVTGRTGGNGKLWYEFEVTNDVTKKQLQANLKLMPGMVADWEVDDIVGKGSSTEELAILVKRLMMLVDECQKTLHE
ncbi:hypothetical protein BG015_008256 [Linnemannia schmuckeri]|uniref:DUF7905 domain-containing protein n=1 Tax=Linnemannia schmuckeri TaxID=64567 RepID=A0A9P5VAG7_9FUNG|nr:hypothetical protein BG015_008256 [Linnemannia schmuckeri]